MSAIIHTLAIATTLGALWELVVVATGWSGSEWRIDATICAILTVCAAVLWGVAGHIL